MADQNRSWHAGGKKSMETTKCSNGIVTATSFNMKYRAPMEEKGFLISGTSPDGALAELIELRGHRFSWPANTTQNFKANRTNRTHSSAVSFAPASPTKASCLTIFWNPSAPSSRAKSRDPVAKP
jgi:hypothetical protein